MKNKVIGILIVGLLMVTVFPCVNASAIKAYEKEDTIIYESSLLGIGFVRINGFTHTLKGFVLFGINDGQVISMEFININYEEANEVLAGLFPPLMFFIRYNPA